MIQSQTTQPRIFINAPNTINATNLKYICEVCGVLFQNIDSLKQHLTVHSQNKNAFNSKINSILTMAKNGLIQTTKKTSSSVISIPQSMTVFNLKDISSKLGSQSVTSTPTTVTSPPIINSTPIVTNKTSVEEESKKDEETKPDNSVVLKTVFQLEEPINFYELKNEQLIEFKSNPAISLLPSVAVAAQNFSLSSLPYHYSENENIYVCNLCNCTYDSLRSIKAHLWKHSGHHELSYPIHDHSNRIAETTGKPIVTLKAETNRKTIRSLQFPVISQPTQAVVKENQSETRQSGGICSALLEVIEKLRETETGQKQESKRKRKLQTDKSKAIEPKIRKKRKTTQKVKQLIQIQDEINFNNLKQQEVIKNLLSNQDQECTIETSVVNSLYEDEETLLNKLVQETKSKPKCTFYCHTCHSLVPQLPEHKCFEAPSCECKHFDYFLCQLCKTDIEQEGFYCHSENNWFKHFPDLEALKTHCKTEHCESEPQSEHVDSPASVHSNININQNNSEMLKLLELLANNDGTEQYACGLCLYVCYHLPSLKSHMWTHVKNEKFDYSINTAIINAALDYENKLNRSLALINNSIKFRKHFSSDDSKEESDSENDELNFSLNKKISSALDLINYKDMEKKCNEANVCEKSPESIVAFRCSKCGFETIDLCILRLHKRNHFK